MSEKATDNFENGVFWELYNDLERQFQSFLEYVPYLPGNETVYSFKLLNLILVIGGHVDSAFKEMARYPRFTNNDDCKEILKKVKKKQTVPITLPLKAFETEYKLSEETAIFKRLPKRENIKPFKPRSASAKSPKWWKIYNGIKHDAGVNIRDANLQTTRDALAGAFLLNVIHTPAYIRLIEYRVVKPEPTGRVRYDLKPGWKEKIEDWIMKKKRRFGVVETPIFIHYFAGAGARISREELDLL